MRILLVARRKQVAHWWSEEATAHRERATTFRIVSQIRVQKLPLSVNHRSSSTFLWPRFLKEANKWRFKCRKEGAEGVHPLLQEGRGGLNTRRSRTKRHRHQLTPGTIKGTCWSQNPSMVLPKCLEPRWKASALSSFWGGVEISCNMNLGDLKCGEGGGVYSSLLACVTSPLWEP